MERWFGGFCQAKQQLQIQKPDDRLVTDVVIQYTKLMIHNLTENITKFKSVSSSLYDEQNGVVLISRTRDIRYLVILCEFIAPYQSRNPN